MKALISARIVRQVAAFAIGVALIAVVEVALAGPAEANVDRDGLGLRGYDPVAYFNEGRAVPGKLEFSAAFASVTYRFASPANRDAFNADPGKYAPQYGGYCAFGAALGKKFDGDPNVWSIVDGKLYLNLNADAAKAWNKDIPGNVARANAKWPRIKDRPAGAL